MEAASNRRAQINGHHRTCAASAARGRDRTRLTNRLALSFPLFDPKSLTDSMASSQRFIRQSQFAAIGVDGQRRIESSAVAVLGCGALGSVAAELLVRAGVGRLTLIDRDWVEWSNLQRQALYDEHDAEKGASKSEAAARHLRRIHSSVTITEIVRDVTPANIDACLGDVDLVIDASDNFALRLLLNDWSLQTHTAWVHGGAVGASGQVRLFTGNGGPCFRCLVPEIPDPAHVQTCDTAGVIGPATHLIASLQSAEAIKWLSGNRDAVSADVISVDLWGNQTRRVSISPSLVQTCPACTGGRRDFLSAAEPTSQPAISLCGRDAVQIAGGNRRIDLGKVAERWRSFSQPQATRFFVRLAINESQSLTLFGDGRAVISGVRDVAHARSLYDRYVGG